MDAGAEDGVEDEDELAGVEDDAPASGLLPELLAESAPEPEEAFEPSDEGAEAGFAEE